jgi:predicted ATPase
LFNEGMHHLILRDSRRMTERADEMLSIATKYELSFYTIGANFLRGWAVASAGQADEGIAEMRQSITDPRGAQGISTALLLVALAETCGRNRRPQEGLEMVAQGLMTAEQTGLKIAEAELHRLKGELMLLKEPGREADAEICFRTSIDIARRQTARLFELRATTSLARLLATQAKRDEARTMLAAIYNWFTEGFDTADLKDAKALLEELSG